MHRKQNPDLRKEITNFFVRNSCELESVQLSGIFIVVMLFAIELLGIILPVLVLIQPTQGQLLFTHYFMQKFILSCFQNQPLFSFIFQITHLCIIILIFTFLVLTSNKIKKIGLRLCILYYYFSHQILVLTSQELVNFQSFDTQKIFHILNIFLGLCLCLIFSILRWSYSCRGINYTLIFPSYLKNICDILTRILVICLPFALKINNSTLNCGFILAFLFTYFAQLYILNTSFIYFKKSAFLLGIICLQFKFTISILAFIQVILDEVLLSDNFYITACSTFAFSFMTLNRFICYQGQILELKDIDDLESEQQALLQVYSTAKTFLKQEENSYNKTDLMIATFKHDHMSVCEKVHCFCKHLGSLELEKEVVKTKLDKICEKFKKSFLLLTYIDSIKLEEFQVYATVLDRFRKLQLMEKNQWLINFLGGKCFQSINNFLMKKNSAVQAVATEKIIQVDNISLKLSSLIEASVYSKTQFWEKIYKSISSTQQLDSNIAEQLRIVKQAYEIQNVIYSDYKQSRRCLDLLMAYYSYIQLRPKIPKKLKQAVKQLVYNNNDKSLLSMEKGTIQSTQKIVTHMYNKHCCLFQSNIQTNNMGVVLNSSKTVKEVFGFERNVLKNLNINKLMPKSMHQQHDRLLNNWVSNGSWDNIAKIRYIFALSGKEICFQTAIYLKIIQKYDGLSLIAAFFMINDQDYMLINDKGIIDGAGLYFIELLGKKIVGLPLHTICEKYYDILEDDEQKKQKSKFFTTVNLEEKIQKFYYEDSYNSFKKNYEKLTEKCYFSEEKSIEIEFDVINYSMGNLKFKVLRIIKFEDNQRTFIPHNSPEQNQNIELASKNEDDQKNMLINCGSSSLNSSVGNIDLAIQQTFQVIRHSFFFPQTIHNKYTMKCLMMIALLSILGILCASATLVEKSIVGLSEKEFLMNSQDQKRMVQKIKILTERSIKMVMERNEAEIQEQNLKNLKEIYEEYGENIEQIPLNQIKPLKQLLFQLQSETYWTFQDGSQIIMQPNLFIARFLFHLYQINSKTLDSISSNIQSLYKNYQMLNFIIIRLLELYQQMNLELKEQNFIFLVVLKSVCVILLICLVGKIWMLYSCRDEQSMKLIMQLGFIEKSNAELLKEYFMKIGENISDRQDNSTKQESKSKIFNFDHLTDRLLFNQRRQSENRFTNQKKYNPKIIACAFLAIACSFAVNGFGLLTEYNYKTTLIYLQQNYLDLMKAETQFVEATITLEFNQFINDTVLEESILRHILENQKTMNVPLLEIMPKFIDFFQTNFPNSSSLNPLLSQDICVLLSDYGYNQLALSCKQDSSYQTLQKGLLVVSSLYQRTILTLITELQNNSTLTSINQGNSSYYVKTFSSAIFYSSYVFQILETAIRTKIIEFIDYHIGGVGFVVQALVIISFFFTLLLTYLTYKKDQQKISLNMGKIVILPLSVIKATKYMIKEISIILEV